MNNVLETIYNRRAVRKYKQKAVERVTVDDLLDAGRMAPSAMNLQPWKFIVVTDAEMIADMDDQIRIVVNDIYKTPHIAEFLKTTYPIFHHAPVVVFIAAPRDNEWAGLDVGMCAQNIMLAAKASGLDTCPVGFAKFIERTSIYSQLDILPTDQVLISLTIGYGDEDPPVHERRKDNVFYLRRGVSVRT